MCAYITMTHNIKKNNLRKVYHHGVSLSLLFSEMGEKASIIGLNYDSFKHKYFH